MASSEKVVIEIDLRLEDGSIQKAMATVEKEALKGGKKSGSKFSKGFKDSIGGLASKLKTPMKAVAIAFTGIVTGSVLAAAKVERLSTQFGTLLRSTSAAKKQMESLQQFAASTPFQLEGIADASKQLLAFGFSQQESINNLTSLGDAAAASGADIKDLAQIFGQINAAGKLTGERFNQLAEKAIPIGKAIADTMGIAESAVRGMVSKGQVDFKTFEKAFKSLSDKGGLFAGGMEKLSKTTGGLFSTLKDNIFLTFAKIGKAFEPITKQLLKSAIKTIGDIKEAFSPDDIIKGLFRLGRAINEYVILPIEFLKNAAMLVFNSLRTSIQLVVTSIAKSIQSVAFVMNKVGAVSDETYQSIKNFADGSTEVLGEFATSANENLKAVLDNTLFDATGDMLTTLENNMLAAKAIVEENKPEMDTGFIGPQPQDFVDLNEASTAFFEGFTDKKDALGNDLATITASIKKFGKESKNALVNGFGSAVGSSFAAFGKALANGENALKAFGKAFLNSIGQVLVQEGTANILRGIAISMNPLTAGAGAPLIAAGAAMATFGGVISAVGGGGSTPSASGGVSASEATTSTTLTDETFSDEDVAPTAGKTVNLTVNGNILDRRESGLELANILNEAIDSDSVIINQSFA